MTNHHLPIEYDVPDLGCPLESALCESRMVYYFAALRDIIKTQEATFHPDLSDEEKKCKNLVNFVEPGLVITQMATGEKPFPSAYMHAPVSFDDIKLFLDKNKGYFSQEYPTASPHFVPDGSNTKDISLIKIMDDLDSDCEFIDFDDRLADEGLKTELIFCIMVNRTHKRISLVFRGTVNFKDMLVDGNFWRSSNDLIQEITTNGASVHSGFKGYLTRKTKLGGGSQFENLSAVLKELYAYKGNGRDYSDHKLLISGHSLGGSLAQLCSFLIGGSPTLKFIPSPIRAVTVASPVVGDKNFFKAYRELEKEGRLRHIRISNDKDIICGDPTPHRAYVQTGVNIHVKENGVAEMAYSNTRHCIQLLSTDPLGHHMIYTPGGYFERLFGKDPTTGEFINKDILDMTTQQMYDAYADLGAEDEKEGGCILS